MIPHGPDPAIDSGHIDPLLAVCDVHPLWLAHHNEFTPVPAENNKC